MDDGFEVRRRRDGSIDIAFHVARARRLRAQANVELLRSIWRNALIALRDLRRCCASQTTVALGPVLSKCLLDRQGRQDAPVPHSME
jgi:hypothetical protein